MSITAERDGLGPTATADRSPAPYSLQIERVRRDPFFYIVDHDLTVLSASMRSPDDLVPSPLLPPEVHRAVKRLLRSEMAAAGTLVAALGDDTIVRLVPTGGKLPRYVIFIESYQARDVLGSATQQYHFTARELEVLKLLLHGDSTGDIAAELFISHFTVLQHVKNIGRRMRVSKRKEIVARLLGIR